MLKLIVSTVEIVAVVGFVVMVGLLVLKQPTKNLTALPPRSPAAAGQTGITAATDGGAVFRSNCSGCHGADGGGGIGPQFDVGRGVNAVNTPGVGANLVQSG